MAAPTLTQAQIDQLNAELARQQNFATQLTAQIPAQIARAAELSVADGAFQEFFQYFNDDIIGNYDNERRFLDGTFQADPITEADIIGPANIDGTVRTTPSLPDTDIVRVPEFDGGNTSIDAANETQHIIDQADAENTIQNGFGSGTPTTAETTDPLTAATTVLGVEDTVAITISPGDVYVVASSGGGSDLAVIQVDSVTDTTMPPMMAPFTADLGITIIVPPTGSIAVGAEFDEFLGFTNAERTSQTATNPSFQPLMDSLIQDIEDELGLRLTAMAGQTTALAANDDPDGTTEIAAAQAAITAQETFINNFLAAVDVSDTGLASLASNRSARNTEISSRVAEIIAAYTGQTENYYDRRYQLANDRANTARGTLRLQIATSSSVATSTQYAADAQAAADAITDLLP